MLYSRSSGAARTRGAFGNSHAANEKTPKQQPGAVHGKQRENEKAKRLRGARILSVSRSASLARATERMPARTLVVQVLRADNLIIADIGGTSDPYVRLSIGKQERKTQTKWVRSSLSTATRQ